MASAKDRMFFTSHPRAVDSRLFFIPHETMSGAMVSYLLPTPYCLFPIAYHL